MLTPPQRGKVKFLLGIVEDSWMIGTEPDRSSHSGVGVRKYIDHGTNDKIRPPASPRRDK